MQPITTLKAVMDEAQSLQSMYEAIFGNSLNVPEAAKNAVIQSLHAAYTQTCVAPNSETTPASFARVGMSALRNLVMSQEVGISAIRLLATQLFRTRVWLALGMSSWREYVNHALTEGENAANWEQELGQMEQGVNLFEMAGEQFKAVRMWKYELVTGTEFVLARAQEYPAKLPDGQVVDHVFLAQEEPSAIRELIPPARQLDMDKPEDAARWNQLLTDVATKSRQVRREEMRQQGLRNSRPDLPARQPVTVDLVEILDTGTGEVANEWRVPPMVFGSEMEWHFFQMALSRRYEFRITTKAERIAKKNAKPKSKSRQAAPSTRHRRGRGK
jgi:hypothetical protein